METIFYAKISTNKKRFYVDFDSINDVLLIETKSAPEKNKANEELLKGLKKKLHSDVRIVSGFSSKNKRIEICLPREEALALLSNKKILLLNKVE
jgi:uncharacterized protein (TIGR00251 family)